MKVNAETVLCASIGNPNKTSRAPIMHNAGFEKLGINYVYMAFEPRLEDLPGVFMGMRALGIRGYSITKPFKETILPFLDELDSAAQDIGAVNTVLNENGKLKGFNSDWVGAVSAIEEITPLNGKRVILVGAGGAGRAIAYGLKLRGASVTIYNRSVSKAEALAEAFDIEIGGDLKNLSRVTEWDILINATSMGMLAADAEKEVPISVEVLQNRRTTAPGIVFDIAIYPRETPLLRVAREAGFITIPGARMLLLQGMFQFRLFTGHEPPIDAMWQALEASLL